MSGAAGAGPAVVRRFAPRRWPTGAKLFLALSFALLPLAVIATLATWRTASIFNEDARARLQTAAAGSSRALEIELAGDMTALAAATDALDRDPADAPSCARVQGMFAIQSPMRVRFDIDDAHGRLLCGEPLATGRTTPGEREPHPTRPRGRQSADVMTATIVPGSGLLLHIRGNHRHVTAQAFFPAAFLTRTAHPNGVGTGYGAALEQGDQSLLLAPTPHLRPREGALDRRDTIRTPLGIDRLVLAMETRKAPITWPFVLALLLPLLMWAAAASIAWFVVDRLLVRPLRRLRASVAAYHPGDVIDPGDLTMLPAQEIADLGDTFRAISRTVALHEAGLAEGLLRQTRLTREVHHRVKNNLQVISSLINIHARGSRGTEAAAAYASIQRRVDALAVVHRNHFAENESHRGLPLRSVLGELASNIRATAPDESAHMGLALDIDPFLVGQDVAVAVAFLVTELTELAMSVDPTAQIRIALRPAAAEDRATLSVTALALVDSAAVTQTMTQRYGRVIEGLARQLRSPMRRDGEAGRFEIDISVTGRD